MRLAVLSMNGIHNDREGNIMIKKTVVTGILLSIAITGWLMLTESPVMAVTIHVNSTEDVIADDGKCTLREAVIAANTNTGSGSVSGECPAGDPLNEDEIVLQVGVYSLTIGGTDEDNAQTGDLDILDDLTVTGTTADETIIDANGIDRVFEIMSDVKAKFKGIAITNGGVNEDSGGGISNKGTLKIAKCTVSDNTASANSSAYGGGIYNDGTMKIASSTVSGNTVSSASDDAYGGGIYNDGTLKITKSMVSDNTASGDTAYGGGICNDTNGTITITYGTVSDNTASGDYAWGGGISNWGTIKMTSSIVSYNTASGGQYALGGGIFNDGIINITYGTVSDNTASGDYVWGGGILNSGTLKLNNSKVSDNMASSVNAEAYGGGICNYVNGTIKIAYSKVSGNMASSVNTEAYGGGIYNDGTIKFKSKSKITGNAADDGGGLFNNGSLKNIGQARIKNNLPDNIVDLGP